MSLSRISRQLPSLFHHHHDVVNGNVNKIGQCASLTRPQNSFTLMNASASALSRYAPDPSLPPQEFLSFPQSVQGDDYLIQPNAERVFTRSIIKAKENLQKLFAARHSYLTIRPSVG